MNSEREREIEGVMEKDTLRVRTFTNAHAHTQHRKNDPRVPKEGALDTRPKER